MIAPAQSNVQRKVFLKIGRPGYRVTKVRDRDTGKEGMMVQVHLPQIKPDVIPPEAIHERLGAEEGTSQQGLPIPHCESMKCHSVCILIGTPGGSGALRDYSLPHSCPGD